MSYATRTELADYAPAVVGTDAFLDRLLLDASRDLDRWWGMIPHSATATDGLKYDLTTLDADTAEGIKKATLAQAEFRNHVGPDYFLDLPGTTVQGPDFTITTGGPGAASGWSKYLGSKTLAELASYGLLRATARARP